MVRVCQAEESVQAYFDYLVNSRGLPEVGLLIGKAGVGSKDLLLAVIKTPSQDGRAALEQSPVPTANVTGPAKKGQSKQPIPQISYKLSLHQEQIADHVRQMLRALPGGLSVLGLYLFCSDSVALTSSPTIEAVLHEISKSLQVANPGISESSDLFTLQADTNTRKTTLKSWSLKTVHGNKLATPHPADLKYGAGLSNFVCLICRYSLTASLSASAQLEQLHEQVLKQETTRMQQALLALGDAMPSLDTPMADCLPLASSSNAADVLGVTMPKSDLPLVAVDLYIPFTVEESRPSSSSSSAAAAAEASTSAVTDFKEKGTTSGRGRLRGSIIGMAYVHKREPWRRALQDLKYDLQNTLSTRLDMLVEDALLQQEDARLASPRVLARFNHPLLTVCVRNVSVALPKRALLPAMGGMLWLSDYLVEGEDSEAVAVRADELLGLEVGPGQVVIAEQTSTSADAVEAAEDSLDEGEVDKVAGGMAPAAPATAAVPDPDKDPNLLEMCLITSTLIALIVLVSALVANWLLMPASECPAKLG